MIKIKLFLVCILSFVGLVYSSKCPDPELIYPCRCIYSQRTDIVCEGHGISDLSKIIQGKLKPSVEGSKGQFNAIYIRNTSITSIARDTFYDGIFSSIFINNNPNLTKIDLRAFSANADYHPVYVLEIMNSPKLVSGQIFDLVNTLKVTYRVSFTNLGITEIPDEAFTLNPEITNIIISNNPHLRRIGKSPFSKLPSLSQLIMYENQVNEIDANGLTFDLSIDNGDLLVVLSSNHLTTESFHHNWSNSKIGIRKIKFEINPNLITSLPGSAFKDVLLSSSTNYMSFGGNHFVCDCNMKYLFDIRSQVEDKLRNVVCVKPKNQDFFKLNVEDLGVC